MGISVPKTKVMVVSTVPAPVVTFTCNGNPVEQVATFKHMGVHFHQSGSIAHLVMPIKLKAGGSWAAVQWHHSLLQCGNTINLHLHLLQAILVPVLQYGCQIWGMHSPRVAAANDARAAFQRLNDYYLRHHLPSFTIHSSQAYTNRVGPLAFASGGATLCNFGIVWLVFLLVSSTTLPVWTTLPLPFRGVLAIWLAHWRHVCIQWVLRCCACMMWCPCQMSTVLWRLQLAEYIFWQSASFSCSPHSRCCFMHIRAVVQAL